VKANIPFKQYKESFDKVVHSSSEKIKELDDRSIKLELENMARIKEKLEKKLHSINNAMQILKSRSQEKDKPKLNRSSVAESYNDFHRKRIKANEFVRRINQEKAMLNQKRIKRNQIEFNKEVRLAETLEKESKRKNEYMRVINRQKVFCSYEKLRKEREVQRIKWKEAQHIALPNESSYLFNKYKRRYERMFVLPMIQQRKTQLLKRHELMKSATLKELKEHQKVYKEQIQQRKKLKEEELEAKREVDKVLVEESKKFQTGISLTVKLMDDLNKQQQQKQLVHKDILRKKGKKYAEILSCLHKVDGDYLRESYNIQDKDVVFVNLGAELPTTTELQPLNNPKQEIRYFNDLNDRRTCKNYNRWRIRGLEFESKYDESVRKAKSILKNAEIKENSLIETVDCTNEKVNSFVKAIKAKIAMLNEFN